MNTERANALSLSAAAVGLACGAQEGSHAEGIYHGTIEGFKAQHEREYLREWPRLLAARAKRDRMVLARNTTAPDSFMKFMQELDDFEAYMKSLTEVKAELVAPNVVTDVGANYLLNSGMAASSLIVVGPYMGLIGAVSYTGIPVVGDTMSSHASASHVWTEGGGTNAPTYSGTRKTVAWSAAASRAIAPSAAPVFTFTGSGTAKGVFIVLGTSAVATLDSTAGTLYSAGVFSGGDQAVVSTNTLTVTYSTSL